MKPYIDEVEKKANNKGDLVAFLEGYGVPYTDLRDVQGQGTLRIPDTFEARRIIEVFKREDSVVFNYAQYGHSWANYKPDWWTTHDSTVSPNVDMFEMRLKNQKLKEDLTLKLDYDKRIQRIRKSCNSIYNFMVIPRENLLYHKHENCMILYESHIGEAVGWRFPGLESSDIYLERMAKKGRNGKKNKYDFKPDLLLKDNRKCIKPVKNREIAEALVKYVESSPSVRKELCALLIHIAYMTYHVGFNGNTVLMDVYFDDVNKNAIYTDERIRDFHFYKLDFPDSVGSFINNMGHLELMIDTSRYEISMEALLYYIDILGNQEECKYHYNDILVHTEKRNDKSLQFNEEGYNKDKKIYKQKGRINFILTLANVVRCAGIENLKSNLAECFSKMDCGVVPIPEKDFEEATGELIIYEE